MSTDGFLGLVVPCCAWPLHLRRKIACACAVSFRWLRLSVADRDLASQDLSLVVLPSMRLICLPRARREARFAQRREERTLMPATREAPHACLLSGAREAPH